MARPACPQCGAELKMEEVEKRSVGFPCPACGIRLQFPDWYLVLTFYGTIAAPPLIFWALGFSWPQFVMAELLLGYPILWLVVHYKKYILRPKLVFYVPRPPLGGSGSTELHLRDGPRR
jgi:hypothetical protein